MKSDLELTGEQIEALILAGFEPTSDPQLIELEERGRKMGKKQEVVFTLVGRTNTTNIARISPEVLTVALFELLYDLHGHDYARFRESCVAAYTSTVHHDNARKAA